MNEEAQYVLVEKKLLRNISDTILDVFGTLDTNFGNILLFMKEPDSGRILGYNGHGEIALIVTQKPLKDYLYSITSELQQADNSEKCSQEVKVLSKGLAKFSYDIHGVDYTKIAGMIHEAFRDIVDQLDELVCGDNPSIVVKLPEGVYGKEGNIDMQK